MPILATNKKALANYDILEKIEAGIVLSGAEVKSAKMGGINLKNSYATLDSKSEFWLLNCHIAPYKPAAGHQRNYDPTGKRKLLLNKKEITSLIGKTKRAGLTIVPISVYTKGSLIKVTLALATGKKKYDKREIIKKREIDREIRRKMRQK